MTIHLLRNAPTAKQVQEMLEAHESYIKVAVDVRQGILAGGGEFHADCESVLLEDGSQPQDVWGADWVADQQTVRYGALINIRPGKNPAMELQDSQLRSRVGTLVRKFFHAP